jgi:hypothetical protein
MMSDDAITTVRTADDLKVEGPNGRERETIVELLTDGAPGVVWIPEWLMDEKDVAAAGSNYRLAIGELADYSDKAIRIEQADGSDEFLPKSQVAAFTLSDDVDEIVTPQAGLFDYE